MTLGSERQAAFRSRLISGIRRVDLRVQDIDRSLTFYRDAVGLEPAESSEFTAILGSPGSEGFLKLDSSGVTKPADPTATGLFHTAFRFPTRAALGDALARLVEADYEIGAGDHLVSEALYVDDLDGNGVELYWDRPVEEWPPPTEDMLVPMATLPVDLESLLAAGQGRAAVGGKAPDGSDIGHIHLQVADLDATIPFYVDHLGLDLTARLGRSAGFFSSYGYHHNIGANTWRSRGGKPTGRESAGLQRVMFKVDDRSEFHRLRERLSASHPTVVDEQNGSITLNDPNGIELKFIAG